MPLGQDCVSLGRESGCPSGKIFVSVRRTGAPRARCCVSRSGEWVPLGQNIVSGRRTGAPRAKLRVSRSGE